MVDFLNVSANIIALVALWLAYLSYKASAKIWFRVLAVESCTTQSVSENSGAYYHDLTITVQNCGIPLPDLTAHLCFKGEEYGRYLIQLLRTDFEDSHRLILTPTEMTQGMAAKFSLRSYRVDERFISVLSSINDPRRRDLKINIKSQGFMVFEYALSQRFFSLKMFINKIAFRINRRFDRSFVTSDGQRFLALGDVLPRFDTDRQSKPLYFINQLRKA